MTAAQSEDSSVDLDISHELISRLSDQSIIFCRHGLVFAKGGDGTWKHVDEVPNGKDSGCTCPQCGRKLVAKNHCTDEIRHIAHAPGGDCGYQGESLLHRVAKEILRRERRLMLPAFVGSQGWFDGLTIVPADTVSFDKVELEQALDRIRPDVTATKGPRILFIEIAVTHTVDAAKLERLRQIGTAAIEICLRALHGRTVSLGDVKKAVLFSSARKWLFNEILEKKLSAQKALLEKYGDFLPRTPLGVTCPDGGGGVLSLIQRPTVFASRKDCGKCCYFGWDNPNAVVCFARTRIQRPSEIEMFEKGLPRPGVPRRVSWDIGNSTAPKNHTCPRCKTEIQHRYGNEWVCANGCVEVHRRAGR